MFTDFAVWLDVGSGFARLGDGTMTDSTPGGNPDSGNLVTTFAGMAANGSIYNTTIVANGTDDVPAPSSLTREHGSAFKGRLPCRPFCCPRFGVRGDGC
jgi:hypothetical protein